MVTPCFGHYTMVAITQNVHRYFDLTLSHVNNPLCMLTLLNVSGMSAYVNCVKGNRYLRVTLVTCLRLPFGLTWLSIDAADLLFYLNLSVVGIYILTGELGSVQDNIYLSYSLFVKPLILVKHSENSMVKTSIL